MADNTVHVGPWGGNGGDHPWTFIPDGRITQINIYIRSGHCVDGIRFTFTDHSGVIHQSATFGGLTGKPYEVRFGNNEQIIKINGSVGVYEGHTVVTSLSFVTNTNTYGPYGQENGTNFLLPVTKGKVIGFYGKYGRFLDSFGVVLAASSL